MSETGLTRRAVGAALAALAASCAPAPRKAGLGRPVRIGFQRSGVLLLAKARGGLDAALAGLAQGVQWVEFPSGPPMMEALGAGAIDLGAVGETPPIFAQAAASPILYAAAQPLTGASAALLVPAGSRAETLEDLKGRKIAFTKATSAHLFMIQALRRANLTLKSIQPIYLAPADAAGAFTSGAIDAWTVWDPYYALAQRNQKARVILTGEVLPPTSAFFIASRDFAQSCPAVLSATLGALKAQALWAESHRGEVAGIIAKATGLPLDIAAATLRRGPFAVRPMDDSTIAAQQGAADLFHDIGAIPARIDVGADAWRGWAG
jgi:aliphatic sulfonates family ABC transporter substrate-binding protein